MRSKSILGRSLFRLITPVSGVASKKARGSTRAQILPSFHLVAAAALIGLAVPASASATAQAREADASGLVVAARFSATNDGNPQIVAVNPRTGATRVLTSGSRDVVPDLSPDGRTVVFERCLNARGLRSNRQDQRVDHGRGRRRRSPPHDV